MAAAYEEHAKVFRAFCAVKIESHQSDGYYREEYIKKF